jgi:hypothetical protein
MQYADRLERVAQRCEARGVPVVRVPGWRTRGRIRNGKPQDMISILSLIIHHTATGGTADYRSLKMVTDGRGEPNPLDGPLCNWGGGRMGTLFLVAAGSANHTGATKELWQSNQYASGFEAENNGIGEPWSVPLKLTMTIWAQEMRREFGVPRPRVLGHREVCVPVGRKIDPANFDMNQYRLSTDYPQEDDFMAALTPEQQLDFYQKVKDIHAVLTGPDSVGSRVDPEVRMPLRTMMEYDNEMLTNLVKKLGA